jgi:hypothetical protein
MAEWARAVIDEAFPQTCTWSIAIWEFVYGYEPDDTLPLEFRRGRILSHRLSAPPINPARIEAALSALTGVPVTITEFVADYTFSVTVDESELTAVNLEQMIRVLRQMKPSHLSFESRIVPVFNVTDYHAGAEAAFYREFFYEEIEVITDGATYYAGAIAELIREFFTEEDEVIITDVTDYHAGAAADFTREAFVQEGDPILTDITDYPAAASAEYTREAFVSEGDPILTDVTDYSAGAEATRIREWHMEEIPIVDTVTSYDGGATHEITKEEHTDNG